MDIKKILIQTKKCHTVTRHAVAYHTRYIYSEYIPSINTVLRTAIYIYRRVSKFIYIRILVSQVSWYPGIPQYPLVSGISGHIRGHIRGHLRPYPVQVTTFHPTSYYGTEISSMKFHCNLILGLWAFGLWAFGLWAFGTVTVLNCTACSRN